MGPAQLRSYWGTQIAMVFQDPMTSLNPVMRIGKQITESLEVHTDMDRKPRPAHGWRCCGRSTSPSRSGACGSTRTSCRAACASGW